MSALTPEAGWIDLLAVHETAFERIVAHSPKLAKFGRVLSDERVADRLTVRDVAHMLDLSAQALLAVAAGEPVAGAPDPAMETVVDALWADEAARHVLLDLRPVFADGHEPLALVIDEIQRLPDGAALVIEAPFHPTPLRRLLSGRGFQSVARQLAPDHWRVDFRRPASAG